MITPSAHGRFPGGDMSVDYSTRSAVELNRAATSVDEHDGFFRFEGTCDNGPWVVDLLLPPDVDEERHAEWLAELRAMVRP